MDEMNASDVIASGEGPDSLKTALSQLPPGDYSVAVYSSGSDKVHVIDITNPEENQGVGFPFLIIGGVIATLVGGYFGWQILKETSSITSSIPKWAWYIGGAFLLLIAYRMVFPASPSGYAAGPAPYYPPPQYYLPPTQ